VLGDPLRPAERLRLELLGGHGGVDHAELRGLPAVEALAEQQELLRLQRADEQRQQP
jgi:hypothetical protein